MKTKMKNLLNHWTDEEIKLLATAVQKHGENWDLIGRIIGKSNRACRNKAIRMSFAPRRKPQSSTRFAIQGAEMAS